MAFLVALAGAGLFVAALLGVPWAPLAGWGSAAASALVAALACAGAAGRAEVEPVRRRVWRRIAVALCLVAILATALLIERISHGADAEGDIGFVHAVAQALIMLVFVAPLHRLPGSERRAADRLAMLLDVSALSVVTGAYVWFLIIRDLLQADRITAGGVVAAGAIIVSAMIGVIQGARILLTGYASPYRSLLLCLGGVLVVGGLAPGVLLTLSPYDVDAGQILIPVACLVLAVGARPGGAAPPLTADGIARWRQRDKLLPLVAVAFTDALLLGTLVSSPVGDRLVVGVITVVLTALAVARQLTSARQLSLQGQRFRQLVQNSYDVVTISDTSGTITYMSGGSQRMFGRRPAQRTGANMFELLHPEDRERAVALFTALAAEPGRTELWRARFRHADGRWRRIEVLTTNLLHEPSVRGIVSNTRDVTETHDLAERLSHDATHDALTGLANRALFRDRLTAALAGPVSLVLIDLDDFKIVNDTLGHAAGDELLIAVATRLSAVACPQDTVARLGGDEFALLLPGRETAEVETVLRRLISALRAPVRVESREQGVRASFGIVEGGPGDEAGDLMRRADIAMYEAKARGDGSWQYYLPGMQARGVEQEAATADLAAALDAGEFFLLYQPVVTLPGGALAGVEALVRRRHPVRGPVPPGEFIGLAEQSGLIVELGRFVLREACAQMAAWHRDRPADAPASISVNVSARQLQEPGFAAEVAAALGDSGLQPDRLIVEITESTAVGGGATAESLHRLRRLGVRLSLDDFGTGASTLTLLANCPVDQIKLDRSFVDCDVIASAVLELARGFGVEAVAEGVETAEQAARLAALGYGRAQGFHFAHPLPAAGIVAVAHQAV
ncbi:putative diguanylate cyclase/phosphodiesterase with PAS sensor [Actinoplanes friuliensis DSM 7358]|uniref:Putative diguanylate cyclase/phosphodiesterase with PAS sensor n=1 Tax=Actinoplanes friuliensis DSM 7358 TaxID=1246995 RepID=U5W2F5_9ACTN|nr:putative diguanylate cyclase/phosphodiesterase with PAS sensor [Actinoplanes friuliensis DSM 7358]